MGSWVPLRSAAPDPLCTPSTSYAIPNLALNSSRPHARCRGVSSRHRRAFHRIRCQITQETQTYHNAFKLLHPLGRPNSVGPASDLHDQQSGQWHLGRQPEPADPDATAQPSHPPPIPKSAHDTLDVSTTTTISPTAPPLPSPPSPPSLRNPAAPPQQNPYTPHYVSLPLWQPPPTSLSARKALTHALSTSPSYTRLHQLLLDNAGEFNSYHTCATLRRALELHAAGLTPRESRLFKEGCSTLQTILRRQVSELPPRSLVVVAYSLARLELPDRELLAGLAAAVEPQLAELQPQGLSSLIWAFGRLPYKPPPKWMDALLAACVGSLEGFGPRELATLLYSLARLQYKLAPAHLLQILTVAQTRMDDFCGRSLSNALYALAVTQQHPGEQWLEAAKARAVALGAGAFVPQSLTLLVWSLTKLGSPPNRRLLAMVYEHVEGRLPLPPAAEVAAAGGQVPRRVRRSLARYGCLDMVTLITSLARWGARPPAELAQKLLTALQWQLPSMAPNQLTNSLWSVVRMRMYPRHMWLSVFFSASYRHLLFFKPGDLSQALWAVARMGVVPPPSWLEAALKRLNASASLFTPPDVANTLWALARLGVRGEDLQGEVLALLFIATDRRLSSFKPQELCAMVWAHARMRRRPDKEWIAEFLKVTYHRLPAMGGWGLATTAWALAELALLPPPAWLYAYVNAARTLLHTSPVAAAQSPWEADARGTTATTAAAGVPTAFEGGGLGTAVAPLEMSSAAGVSGGMESWGPESAGAAAAGGSGLSAVDLAMMIQALRRLNGTPGSQPSAPPGSSSAAAAASEASAVSSNSNSTGGGAGASAGSDHPNGSGVTPAVAASSSSNNGAGAGKMQGATSSNGASVGVGGSGGGRLAKVDDFLSEAEQALWRLEAGSGAYAQEQLRFFLAMPQAPRRAMTSAGESTSPVHGGGVRHDTNGRAEEANTDGEHGTDSRVPRRRPDGQQSARASSTSGRPRGSRMKGPGRDSVGAVSRTSGERTDAATDAGVSSATNAADAVVTAPGVLTQVLADGARVSLLAAASPQVHLELGDLALELPAPSEPVYWHRPPSSTGVPGAAGDGFERDMEGLTSAEEIKNRLLAV